MLKFKEVTYLYTLAMYTGGTEEINTTGGYARIDYNRSYYWRLLTAFPVVPNIPWHFLKEDSTLYLMREEPVFYA